MIHFLLLLLIYEPSMYFWTGFSTFCIVDTANECIAVTVYNLANGQGVIIGDVVAIAMPYLKEIDFTFKDKVSWKWLNPYVSTPRYYCNYRFLFTEISVQKYKS